MAFAIVAVTFVVSLIIAALYLYPGSKKPTNVPGLEPTSEEDGNLGDIGRVGSLHEFLLDLHKQFGPIASFWWGRTYTVSIASANLFKEHQHVFDRPMVLFEEFIPLIGIKCIQYANGTEGRARRHLYDKVLTHDAVKRYFLQFQEVADTLATKWEGFEKEKSHVPLCQYMSTFALKTVLLALFGNQMKDDQEVLKFERQYAVVWAEMEHRLTEPATETREKSFQESLLQNKLVDCIDKKNLNAVLRDIVKNRKAHPPEHGEELMLDLILDYSDDEEYQDCEALVFTIGGFHTTGNLLAWALYFIASHPDVDKKVYEEIQTVLGDEDVDHTNMASLVYLRQVIDETLRCAIIAPWTGRFQDVDSELGGYKIPKNTPVIHALGVAAKDENAWPLPDRFDPDRFSKKNSAHRSHYWFSPFGGAGKRVCPGQKFAYAEAAVCLVTLLRKFKLHLVEGQVVTPAHGLVTHPEEEIWVTLSKR